MHFSFCHSYTGFIFPLPFLIQWPSGVAHQGTCYEDLISQVNHVEAGPCQRCEILWCMWSLSRCEPLHQQCYESLQGLPRASGLSVSSWMGECEAFLLVAVNHWLQNLVDHYGVAQFRLVKNVALPHDFSITYGTPIHGWQVTNVTVGCHSNQAFHGVRVLVGWKSLALCV